MTKAIRFENVWKKFGLRYWSIREAIPSLFGLKGGSLSDFWALQNVSFEVEEGGAFGIVGPNGAGKSTTLKLLSGVMKPTKGKVEVRGKVSSLIEIGAGFHPDLTGRENIYLYGAILGLKKREVERKFDQIVDFSGLEDFLDTPLKRYSSGMYMRLGFSVAAHVDPDVLLIDEVLAVGDIAFQRKCLERIKELRESGTTIVFVSHNLYAVKALCRRGLFLCQGKAQEMGEIGRVVHAYEDYVRKRGEGEVGMRRGSGEAEIVEVKLLNGDGEETGVFRTGDRMVVRMEYVAHRRIEEPVFGVTIRRADGLLCSAVNTRLDGFHIENIEGEGAVELEYRSLNLLPGTYRVTVAIHESEGMVPYDYHENAYTFEVRTDLGDEGAVYLEHRWRLDGKV
jgi:ABC-type polysaccharide/polyol phosphate transport system ATPase subunit